jgi:hypothetical protein
MDRYTRDELLDNAQDFDLAPNRGEQERASATAALHVVPGREETATPLAAGHAYLKSSNPRTTACARCGRPLTASVHLPPELDLAAVLSALHRATKSLREGNQHYATQELAFALRVLRGEP